eukprot:128782-Prymnesium_polylepis.1
MALGTSVEIMNVTFSDGGGLDAFALANQPATITPLTCQSPSDHVTEVKACPTHTPAPRPAPPPPL